MLERSNGKDPVQQTDREILGYSRYVVLVAAFFMMFIISPFEYAWSSMSDHIGGIYRWSHEQVAMMSLCCSA